jgi:hypothetical protein
LKTKNITTVEHVAGGIEALWEPVGVLELNKRLYVSDTNNYQIQKINLETGKVEIFFD